MENLNPRPNPPSGVSGYEYGSTRPPAPGAPPSQYPNSGAPGQPFHSSSDRPHHLSGMPPSSVPGMTPGTAPRPAPPAVGMPRYDSATANNMGPSCSGPYLRYPTPPSAMPPPLVNGYSESYRPAAPPETVVSFRPSFPSSMTPSSSFGMAPPRGSMESRDLSKPGPRETGMTLQEQVMLQGPMVLNQLNSVAEFMAAKGDFPTAIKYYEKISELDGENGAAWTALGHCYLLTDDLAKAFTSYQKALYALPDVRDPQLWYGIGLLYDKFETYEYAIPTLMSVLKLAPNFAQKSEVLYKLAVIYGKTYQLDQALNYFKLATLESTGAPAINRRIDILQKMGVIYIEKGEFPEALKSYEAALTMNPENSKTLLYISWCEFLMNRLIPAQEHIIKSINIKPSDSDSYYIQGRILLASEKYLEAKEAFNRAIGYNQSKALYLVSLGVTNCLTKQYNDAFAHFLKATQLDSSIPETWLNIGILYEMHKQVAEAKAAYEKAIEARAEFPEAVSRRNALLSEAASRIPLPNFLHPVFNISDSMILNKSYLNNPRVDHGMMQVSPPSSDNPISNILNPIGMSMGETSRPVPLPNPIAVSTANRVHENHNLSIPQRNSSREENDEISDEEISEEILQEEKVEDGKVEDEEISEEKEQEQDDNGEDDKGVDEKEVDEKEVDDKGADNKKGDDQTQNNKIQDNKDQDHEILHDQIKDNKIPDDQRQDKKIPDNPILDNKEQDNKIYAQQEFEKHVTSQQEHDITPKQVSDERAPEEKVPEPPVEEKKQVYTTSPQNTYQIPPSLQELTPPNVLENNIPARIESEEPQDPNVIYEPDKQYISEMDNFCVKLSVPPAEAPHTSLPIPQYQYPSSYSSNPTVQNNPQQVTVVPSVAPSLPPTRPPSHSNDFNPPPLKVQYNPPEIVNPHYSMPPSTHSYGAPSRPPATSSYLTSPYASQPMPSMPRGRPSMSNEMIPPSSGYPPYGAVPNSMPLYPPTVSMMPQYPMVPGFASGFSMMPVMTNPYFPSSRMGYQPSYGMPRPPMESSGPPVGYGPPNPRMGYSMPLAENPRMPPPQDYPADPYYGGMVPREDYQYGYATGRPMGPPPPRAPMPYLPSMGRPEAPRPSSYPRSYMPPNPYPSYYENEVPPERRGYEMRPSLPPNPRQPNYEYNNPNKRPRPEHYEMGMPYPRRPKQDQIN